MLNHRIRNYKNIPMNRLFFWAFQERERRWGATNLVILLLTCCCFPDAQKYNRTPQSERTFMGKEEEDGTFLISSKVGLLGRSVSSTHDSPTLSFHFLWEKEAPQHKKIFLMSVAPAIFPPRGNPHISLPCPFSKKSRLAGHTQIVFVGNCCEWLRGHISRLIPTLTHHHAWKNSSDVIRSEAFFLSAESPTQTPEKKPWLKKPFCPIRR